MYRFILNAFVAVDSFFVLSGCLLAYLTFGEMDRTEGRINLPLYYIHRYIRSVTLLPAGRFHRY